MQNNEILVCRIITFSEDDLVAMRMEFPPSSIRIDCYDTTTEFSEDVNVPTIIVGWKHIKKLYPEQRISNKVIKENLFWVYDITEDKGTAITTAKNLINSFFVQWLPEEYIPYDYVLDGKLSAFLAANLNSLESLFIYFAGKAMYIYSPSDEKKIIGVSLESMKYAGADVRKAITAFIGKYKPVCFSYKNTCTYITKGYELPSITLENLYWVKETDELVERKLHDIIMDESGVRFIPYLMHLIYKSVHINDHEQLYLKRMNRKDVITEWLSDCDLYFRKDYVNERIKFKKSVDNLLYTKLDYSNKRTLTGRINCSDKRFNPQMLDKKGEDRTYIISRFKGGKIVTFDYVAFEIRLSLFLTQDDEFIRINKDKDLHTETAKVIFHKTNISVQERVVGKSVNNTLLYGGGKELVKSKMQVSNPEDTLTAVELFLAPILDMRSRITESCEELGYLVNSFGTIVRPQKSWAIFNNFMQALAADILVEKLYKIKELLHNHHSKFLFQVHDSFVFDFHPDEMFLLKDIQELLSVFNEITLPVEYCIGDSWHDCAKTELVSI